MSEFTVTVTPSETFPDNTNVTRAMLRNAATPQVSLSGTIGTSDISNGAITDAKVSATAAINGTKLGITRGAILAGGVNDAGVILHPDTSTAGAFAAGGYDGVSNNKRARFVVSRGTNPNEMGLIGTDLGTVGGDIKIDVVDDRLKVDIQNGKVDAKHISSTIGGQSLTPSGNAYNDNPTIGITGSDDDTYIRVIDNSIKLAQLGHVGSAYFGSVIAFTSDGSPAYIPKGQANQVLTSNGNSNPTWKSLYTTFNLGDAQTSAKAIRVKHGLGYTPTDLHVYLKCKTAAAENTQYWASGDVVYINSDHDSFVCNISADGTHIIWQQNGAPFIYEKATHGVDTSSDSTGTAVAFTTTDLVNDWIQITPSNWTMHVIAR